MMSINTKLPLTTASPTHWAQVGVQHRCMRMRILGGPVQSSIFHSSSSSPVPSPLQFVRPRGKPLHFIISIIASRLQYHRMIIGASTRHEASLFLSTSVDNWNQDGYQFSRCCIDSACSSGCYRCCILLQATLYTYQRKITETTASGYWLWKSIISWTYTTVWWVPIASFPGLTKRGEGLVQFTCCGQFGNGLGSWLLVLKGGVY